MGFLTSLFGGSDNTLITAALALGIVLVLIVLGLWLLKLLTKATSGAGRARNRRLAVVDSLMIDQKRQLLIVRRDDVEHLILTGSTQDIVLETGIPAEAPPARLGVRRPAANPNAAERDPRRPAPADKPAPSLRHTGLLRTAGGGEPLACDINDNSAQAGPDSATSAPATGSNGQVESGSGTASEYSNR
jgi:flagellar protein FliO/FliZ